MYVPRRHLVWAHGQAQGVRWGLSRTAPLHHERGDDGETKDLARGAAERASLRMPIRVLLSPITGGRMPAEANRVDRRLHGQHSHRQLQIISYRSSAIAATAPLRFRHDSAGRRNAQGATRFSTGRIGLQETSSPLCRYTLYFPKIPSAVSSSPGSNCQLPLPQ